MVLKDAGCFVGVFIHFGEWYYIPGNNVLVLNCLLGNW